MGRFLLVAALAMTIVGVAVLVLASGVVAGVAATLLLGFAAVFLISLVFLRIGEAEDRDRRSHDPGS